MQDDYTVDIEKLKIIIAEDKKNGYIPICIIGAANVCACPPDGGRESMF